MRPLDDITVVGLTHIGAGPYCLSLLGDMGATIVNIEAPGGDQLRSRDSSTGAASDSAYFHGVNRNKRSICLDLKTSDGRRVANELIAAADVLVENYRVGALDEFGLGYEQLADENPGLVYVSITPWGLNGPDAHIPAMDLVAQARGGIMSLNGYPDLPPCRVPPPIADFISTYLACFGTMLALRARDRTGIGQRVETSLLAGQVATLANFIPYFNQTGEPSQPVGAAHPQLVPYQPFEAADGYFIVACLTQRMWHRLCNLLERSDLASDPRFATNADRVNHRPVLIEILTEVFRGRSIEHWVGCLLDAGVPSGRIQGIADLMHDPQVVANDYIHWFEQGGTRLPVAGIPIKLSGTPGAIVTGAAAVGEHTADVLTELGYSQDEISRLISRGVAGPRSGDRNE